MAKIEKAEVREPWVDPQQFQIFMTRHSNLKTAVSLLHGQLSYVIHVLQLSCLQGRGRAQDANRRLRVEGIRHGFG